MAEKENIFPAVFTRRRVRPVAANAQSEFIGLTDAHDDADGGTTCEQFEKQEITQQAGKGDSSKQCSSYNYNGETERLRYGTLQYTCQCFQMNFSLCPFGG